MRPVSTVGHGTLAADALAELLQAADVGHLVDVRSYPGSRHNPHFAREAMEGWLPITDGARLDGRTLVYDLGTAAPLPGTDA